MGFLPKPGDNFGVTSTPARRLKVFTWHIHGSYLYYLSQGNYDLYIPVNKEKSEGYYGCGGTFPFGSNVIEVAAEDIRNKEFDCILFQTNQNYLTDQYQVLSEKQRNLPRIYLEHDPPWKHPTNTKHVVDDPAVRLVHVTHFNRLMWDNNGLSAAVIEHGVTDPGCSYSGSMARGLVVINNLSARGRLLGLDIFQEVRQHIPLDLIGMGTEDLGMGEILHPQLPSFIGKYRFFFNPIRYTSLGLAVLEAMMTGTPVVGLATTELSTVIRNGTNGYIHTDTVYLIEKMKRLLEDPKLAFRLGQEGRRTALERFNITRFTSDWDQLFQEVTSGKDVRSFFRKALLSDQKVQTS